MTGPTSKFSYLRTTNCHFVTGETINETQNRRIMPKKRTQTRPATILHKNALKSEQGQSSLTACIERGKQVIARIRQCACANAWA